MKPERIEKLMEACNISDAGHWPASAAELLHLLRCARAWAELEREIQRAGCGSLHVAHFGSFRAELFSRGAGASSPDLLTATEAALAKARETT